MNKPKHSQQFMIDVSYGHSLHVEVFGNPSGRVFLFLHGGPGASIHNSYQWAFDFERDYVIAFDQRGCGNSKPFASIENNNTQLLIEDIELIRQHLNIDKWHVFGGSWGATLALCYAIQHPSKVSSLILRGSYLARKQDSEFFLLSDGAAAKIFPIEYAKFIGNINIKKGLKHFCERFFESMNSGNAAEKKDALSRWFEWELTISKLKKDTQILSHSQAQLSKIQAKHMQTSKNKAKKQDNVENSFDAKIVESLSLLECYFVMNNCFIDDNYILKNSDRIKDIPCSIVHGRYDMVCKLSAAYELHQALPLSELYIVEDAGHSAHEPSVKSLLIDIVSRA